MDEKPLINILIRTSNRRGGFLRCLDSVVRQSYPNIRIIIGYDNDKALDYIPNGLEAVFVSADRGLPFFYDCYINQLKELVLEGYFFCLDDDDILRSNILGELPLTGPGLIVQLQRGDYIVPKGLNFKTHHIGMPCLILHHSLKNIANVGGYGAGDSYWIRDVLNQIDLPFVPLVVVESFSRGHGKCNG